MNVPLRQEHIATSTFFIEKSRLQSILQFSVPIIVGMVGFSLVGLIDVAMVGRLGDIALASIGVANVLFLLLFMLAAGVGTSVQTLTARRMGEGNIHLAGYDLNAGILVGSAVGLVLMALGYFILPTAISLMNQDPEVITQGVGYLAARLPQMFFVCIALSFRSYWSGTAKPQMIMLEMVIVVVGNIIFNYLLIFGKFGFPRLEMVGAGLSSTLATVCAVLVYFVFGVKHAKQNGFLQRMPDMERIRTLIRLSIPVSISRFFMSLSMAAMVIIAGIIGTKELAGFNVINSFMITMVIVVEGMGIAAITFVGQALGGKQIKDAKRWGWEVAKVGSGVMFAVGVLVVLFPKMILSLFIIDADTLALAILPLQLSGVYLWLLAYNSIIGSALVGAGATKISQGISLAIQWFAIGLQWILSIHLGYGIVGIPIAFIVAHALGILAITFIWNKERWALIEI